MEDERGNLIKITFEYENAKQSLSGIKAEEWLDRVNSMCVLLDGRGMNPFSTYNVVWDKETK